MLISFTLENWLSFRDPVTFSMVASEESQHGGRVPRLEKHETRVLPIAAIYGGNASGKTNFCGALSFAKHLVVEGVRIDGPIPVQPFALDAAKAAQPSRFVFELLAGEDIYEFGFAATREAVVEEKLVLIRGASEKILYHRLGDNIEFGDIPSEGEFLHYVFRGTRDNQLFLTNAISQKADNFRPVYDWFSNELVLIDPYSRFERFEVFLDENNPHSAAMNDMLSQLDTGIDRIGSEELPLDSALAILPEDLKARLEKEISEGTAVRLFSEEPNSRAIVARSNGKLSAIKLVTYHRQTDGPDIRFETRQESAGSRRLIDLLPVLLGLSNQMSGKVCVIDELDRSLHTMLTRRMLEDYLASCDANTRSQLLLTTHDVLLMDKQLLRLDEMWVTERDNAGASSMFSFSDYKDARHDKDIRKSYLQGRLGGIPRFLLGGAGLGSRAAGEAETKD